MGDLQLGGVRAQLVHGEPHLVGAGIVVRVRVRVRVSARVSARVRVGVRVRVRAKVRISVELHLHIRHGRRGPIELRPP